MSELLRAVTSPAEQAVTDPTVLSALVRMGQDPQDVKFLWDYCGSYPFTKKYVNQRTGEKILVSNRLPMACPDNSLILPLLEPGSEKWHIGNNLFSGEVSTSGRIALTPVVTQPNGLTPDDEVVWEPVLYLNDVAVEPLSPAVRLEVDPVNSNYVQNVLEWDYGICVRRVRVIEGRLCERWYFNESPGGAVRIVHNHIGQFKLGPFAVDQDTEQVTLAQFSEAQFPLTVSATLEVYPDAHPESATVDGKALGYAGSDGDTFANLRARAGDDCNSDATYQDLYIGTAIYDDKFNNLGRFIALFDTSALTSGASISAASLSIYGAAKQDTLSATPAFNIVSSNPATNTNIVPADFSTLGSTDFGGVSYASFDTAGYNAIELNASGIANIQKTGISKFGGKFSNDLTGSAPTWVYSGVCRYRIYCAEQGEGYKPKLVVAYTTGWQGKAGGVVNPEKVGGIGKGDIKRIGGV